MRLWSLHPKYLDTKGLLAVWREALLAQAVLQGKTRGYQAHPQLERFKNQAKPQLAIASYLLGIWDEAARRGYRFEHNKIGPIGEIPQIVVTSGQLTYEFHWLGEKLRQRDPAAFERLDEFNRIESHPLFQVVPGSVADWERVKPSTVDSSLRSE